MPHSLRTLLAEQAARLAGIDSPRLSAEALLAFSLGINREELLKRLILSPDTPASVQQARTFLAACERRAAGEPVAYIVGRKEFMGLDFRVTPHTLIPRPETELLVETALELGRKMEASVPPASLRFADFCTGSGCIAVAFAKAMPRWQGLALDASEGALEVARQNALAHGAGHLAFLRQDIRTLGQPAAFSTSQPARVPARTPGEETGAGSGPEALPRNFLLPQSLDLLLSNPPYVSEQEYREASPEVRLYEPKSALVPPASGAGPSDGFSLVAELIRCAALFLRPGGLLVMELGHSQKAHTLALLPPLLAEGARVLPDLAGRDRVLVARKGERGDHILPPPLPVV